MPCPYFYPETQASNLNWNHGSRLPLGAGWQGRCCASGTTENSERPGDDCLRSHCNLGYANDCPRMPHNSEIDAVRFGVFRSGVGPVISLHFVRERKHLPFDHGTLVFDSAAANWIVRHPDNVLQRQAECFLEVWRAKNERLLSA